MTTNTTQLVNELDAALQAQEAQQSSSVAPETPAPAPAQEEIDATFLETIKTDLRVLTGSTQYSVAFQPKDFLRPKLDEEGKVKPRQFYRVGHMVKVYTQISNWGDTVTDMNFVGQIVSVLDDHLKVRVLAGRKDSPAYVRIARGNSHSTNAGVTKLVTKRSATILDPYAIPVRWYAYASYYKALHRERRLADLRRLRATVQDPRRGFRKWKADRVAWWKKQSGLAETTRLFIAAIKTHNAQAAAALMSRAKWDVAMMHANNYASKHSLQQLHVTSCSHMAFYDETVLAYNRYLDSHTICPHCAADRGQYVPALTEEGAEILVAVSARIYNWSDGTKRIKQEPPVIGAYHSSKKRIHCMPLPDGSSIKSDTLTVGYELEMELAQGYCNDEDDRNAAAREVKKRMDVAIEAAGLKGKLKYAFFERDGSVDSGFEMVTSYGAMETHRYMVPRIFGPVEGENLDSTPFVGILRSHDATASCGLHVHLPKPKSLMHAAKMMAFYNDPGNKRLVRHVARRYATNYARADNRKTALLAGKEAVNALRNAGFDRRASYYSGRTDALRDYVSSAITGLSYSDRYQQVNFCNKDTVEIRVFKGSMLPLTIMACLEFAAAVWHFTRDAKLIELTTDDFLKWISEPRNRRETGYLRTYLAARGYKVYQPKPAKDAKPALNELTAVDA